MKLLEFGLLVKAVDQFSAPIRAMTRGVEALDRAAKNTAGLKKLGQQMDDVGRSARNAGLIAGAAGLGLGAAIGLTQLPGQAVDAQYQLRSIGNVADLTNEQLRRAHSQLLDLAVLTNQTQGDLIAGLATLTSSGLDFTSAMAALPAIGRTATAMGADVNDLAKASFAMMQNLKVMPGELQGALEAAAQAGQLGAFEMKDMARYFPMLTAGAQSFSMTGIRAVAQLGAALQVAKIGAGSPEEAANNLANFMKAILMPQAVMNFKKFGVDLQSELKSAIAKGEDPILAMVQLVKQVSGGDMFKIGELFQDAQVLNFLKPMMADLQKYEDIRDSAFGAKGLVNKNFLNIMSTAMAQFVKLHVLVAKIAMPGLTPVLKTVVSLLRTIGDHPGLAKWLVWISAGLIGGGALLVTMGAVGQTIGFALTGLGKYPAILKFMSSALQGGALRAMYLGDWLRKLTVIQTATGTASLFSAAGLRAAAASTWAFTTALLANPMTWVVLALLAVGAAVYMVIKHWRVLSTEFRALGARLRDAGANLGTMLWEGIKATASRPVEAMRAIATKIRAFLPFSPAKEGPLRDLHRVRLVETLAEAMRPGPAILAMRRVATGVALAGATGAGGATGGGIHITIHAPLTITAPSGFDTSSLEAAHRRQLEAMKRELLATLSGTHRTSF